MSDDYGRGYWGGAPENHSQNYYAGVQARKFHEQQQTKAAEENAKYTSGSNIGSPGEESKTAAGAIGIVILIIGIFLFAVLGE